jgi:hypothetical protein
MDGATMKDYLEDLIKQVEQLEQHFHTLNGVIVQLQMERDNYRDLWMASRD